MIEGDRLPTLTAERIVLRWLTDGDVPALFSIFSNAEVMRYWSSTPLSDEEDARSLLEDIQQSFREHSLFQWGLARRADDLVVGTCTLASLDVANRRAEIGFALGRPYWGQGLGSEGVQTLVSFAFAELDLHRLEADVDPRNAASIRLLERLGFRREGYLRERWLVGGETQDSVYYGLLAREWRG